jgi:glycosyltransferase involved in cell wall biosynthesis
MPVYNEPTWVGRAVADVIEAVRRSPFSKVEMIIVDDGSDQPTRDALAAVEAPFPVRVLQQENQGRFAARVAGLDVADNELVLLIDSRISIREGALKYVCEQLADDPTAVVWNAHVDVDLDGNPYARFWNVLTEVAFRDYFDDPRATSFGLEDFDRFPKGTTCFLAPRAALLDAIASFSSLYEDTRDANDDTILIRRIAALHRINISPGFSCLYRGRKALRPFLRHTNHRGVVFVDGFLHPGTRFFWPLVASYPLSVLAAAAAVRRPRAALIAAGGLPVAFALGALRFRRSLRDTVVMMTLGPIWMASYVLGVWRGGIKAIRNRFTR